ncbi:MAG: hypothetical protein AB7D27_09920 [Desulfomicrobium sp.]
MLKPDSAVLRRCGSAPHHRGNSQNERNMNPAQRFDMGKRSGAKIVQVQENSSPL